MNLIANSLLESKSVFIEPKIENYFTWTSGIKSPIYCDNRQLISYPNYRNIIVKEFCQLIKEKFSHVEIIAGTATAGIPWAAWIAQELNLPMIYIRSSSKAHGRKSAIEGFSKPNQKIIIIEDLISTGKSSIEAFENASNENLLTLGIVSIFNYGFNKSVESFKKHKLNTYSLCSLDDLLIEANRLDQISKDQIKMIKTWKESI